MEIRNHYIYESPVPIIPKLLLIVYNIAPVDPTLVPSWTKISLTHGISSLKKCIKIFLLTWESLVKIAFLLYGGRQFHSVCKM